jgi:hypothetical protein
MFRLNGGSIPSSAVRPRDEFPTNGTNSGVDTGRSTLRLWHGDVAYVGNAGLPTAGRRRTRRGHRVPRAGRA